MTKHGHGLPRKRPGRSAKDEIEEELPELEALPELDPAVDDLPELEAVDELPELEELPPEGPIEVTFSPTGADDHDCTFAVHVPDMPKKEVLEHLEPPFRFAVDRAAPAVRHKRVLVRFDGEGLIGSAVKDLIVEWLGDHKPLRVVVQRGFGDEQVLEGALPTVDVSTETGDGTATVRIDTGECASEDLPVALEAHMSEMTTGRSGARVTLKFGGAARPDATLRDALVMAFREAGARSLAIGARVLFDRDVEEKVRVSTSGNKATVAIALTGEDAATVDALSLVLPTHARDFDGKNVRFQFAKESSAVQAFCVEFARDAGATLVEVGGQDDYDIVWPPLVSVHEGREVVLRLTANGRSRAAVLAAFERECADHHATTQGNVVVVDWPQDFALDAEIDELLQRCDSRIAAKRLCCTVAGDQREPFLPAPVQMLAENELRIIRVDSEAGKPKELIRAIDRRLPLHLEELRGQAVRVEIAGAAAVSRTLKQNLCTAVAEAGAMRLELVEGGEVDLLLPPMLAVTETDAGLSISAVVDGRDDAQQQRAIERELDGVEVALKSVTVADSSAAQAVADFVLAQGASRVVLDGAEPIRVHPPLFESVDTEKGSVRISVEPTGDAAMDARMVDRELAACLKDAGLLVGKTATIVWPNGDADSAAVQAIVAGLRDKKASKVLLDAGSGEPAQLHPEPEPELEPLPEPEAQAAPADAVPTPGEKPGEAAAPAQPATAPAAAETVATPAAAAPAAAAVAAPPAPAGALVTLLGRTDESIPPMVLIGVAAGDDPEHLARLEVELQQHLPRFAGRAVLLVPQAGGADAPVRRATALAELLARVVSQAAAATLVFRGPDDKGRPHFQVLHSSLRALPVGASFGDPRARG